MDKIDLEIRERQAKFLRRKFLEKINTDSNPSMSQNDFAAWLGLAPMTLSRSMPGNGGPARTRLSLENCIQVASVLGPEIFDACGYPRLELDDPAYQRITARLRARWSKYDPETKEAIIRNLNEILDDIEPAASDPRPAEAALAMVPA
jgi:hypothetical protein